MRLNFGTLTTLFILTLISPAFLFAQTENCSNGMDDDGDGLIDCYDPECTCTGPCEDFYYTTCNADCYYIPPCNQISLGVQWQAESETGTYSTLVAGDLDADGIPEVVTYRVEAPNLFIIDGVTGKTKTEIIVPANLAGGTAPAIADLDKDGFGEIVIVGADTRLYCFEHTGMLKYTGPTLVGYGGRYAYSVPNIADFDHDGWAEINIGNQVFNGQTGVLLAQGGPLVSAGEHPARVANGFSFCSPVAIDALPDSFCPDCDGLEIVAGNQVLSVNLVTGTVTPVVTAASPFTDGFTTVADFDRDGDLDAIVQGKRNTLNTVYCWEIETPTIMRQFQLLNNWQEGASRVNVADLNGDGQLEISFVSYPRLYALRNNFSVMWTNTTNDVSAITCSSIFDFCGDGSADVVYRGESFLQILEGATGAVKWQDNCTSRTHIENPLILDVDADGQTEIVIQCGDDALGTVGRVTAYEAVGTPGIASRKVWNQHAYFNTNINEDLSVPRYQQNPHIIGDSLKMNGFLNQYFNPTFPSPDGVLTRKDAVCAGDSILVTAEICNTGDNLLPATTPIAAYKGNPQLIAAQWVSGIPLGFSLQPDSCRTFQFKIPRIANDSVYIVLNDDNSTPAPFNLSQDFPVTAIGECGFLNNIFSLYIAYAPAPVNLGPDTLICDHTSLSFNLAGNDLVSFQWQDNSISPTFNAPAPGEYAVSVTDVCGIVHTDTILLGVDSATVVSLGPPRAMCKGDAVRLGESGFDFYQWKPAGWVDCSTCDSVYAAPSASGFIVLEAGIGPNCVNRDSVLITVRDTFNYQVDTVICYGREVEWNNLAIPPDSAATFYLKTIHGCDSIVHVNVIGTPQGTYSFVVDTSVCQNKTLPWINTQIAGGEQKTFYLTAKSGCDSTVLVKVAPLDTFAVYLADTICFGESLNVFGTPQNQSGVYPFTFVAQNGCDSVVRMNLTVLPQIKIDGVSSPSCFDGATGSLEIKVNGIAPPFDYNWDILGADGDTLVENLEAGNYFLVVTDEKDCTQTKTFTVDAYPPIEFTVFPDSVRCFGEANGAIYIDSPDSTLLFSLDASGFSPKKEFLNLYAATYEVFAQDVYGCIDTIATTVLQPPSILFDLPEDQTLQLGDSMFIEIKFAGGIPIRYEWSDSTYLSCDDCPDPLVKPIKSIYYSLLVTDANGCTATDDIRFTVEKVFHVFAPTVFQPGAENVENGRFQVGYGLAVRRVHWIQIYDRWGSLVYETENFHPRDPSYSWDGKFRGKFLDPGVYIWAMEFELIDGRVERLSGDVTIVR